MTFSSYKPATIDHAADPWQEHPGGFRYRLSADGTIETDCLLNAEQVALLFWPEGEMGEYKSVFHLGDSK